MYWGTSKRRDLKIGLLFISVSVALVLALYVSREIETIRGMILGMSPLATDLDFMVVSASYLTGAAGAYYVGKRFLNGKETRAYVAVLVGVALLLLSLNVLGFSQSAKGREAIQSYAGVSDIYQAARYAGVGSVVLIAVGVVLFLVYRRGLNLRARYPP